MLSGWVVDTLCSTINFMSICIIIWWANDLITSGLPLPSDRYSSCSDPRHRREFPSYGSSSTACCLSRCTVHQIYMQQKYTGSIIIICLASYTHNNYRYHSDNLWHYKYACWYGSGVRKCLWRGGLWNCCAKSVRKFLELHLKQYPFCAKLAMKRMIIQSKAK